MQNIFCKETDRLSSFEFSDAHFGIQMPSGTWVVKQKTLEKQLRKERIWIYGNENSGMIRHRYNKNLFLTVTLEISISAH